MKTNTEKTYLARVPRQFWNARNFVAGFRNLRVPITTASEAQIPGWQPHEVWAPYWTSIRDYCEAHPASQELISAVMAKAIRPGLGTQAHRALFQNWVDRYVPGYRILWETELMTELNAVLAPYGEKTSGFTYGKDGRGALPDRYYHLLAERKFLVVGNHHDILGHFLLFADPEIRRVTEKIIRVSAQGHHFHETVSRFAKNSLDRDPRQREAFERSVLAPLRPVMALLNFSWNLTQEKLYFSQTGKFSLLGAFNTVYNTTFSSKLPLAMAPTTVAGLGVLADQSNRNIAMLPGDMRRWLLRPTAVSENAHARTRRRELEARVDAYARLMRGFDWRGEAELTEATEHARRFHKIVTDTLFAQWGPFRLPMSVRWRKFGAAVQSDAFFSKLLCRESMLKLGEAQIDVAEAALRGQMDFFYEKISPPSAAENTAGTSVEQIHHRGP